ncbi:hypothetical protein D3C71_2068350 [compost metagenome]
METLAGDALGATVGVGRAAGHEAVAVEHRDVVLGDAEHRQRRIELAVRETALDAGLVALALDRVQQRTAHVAVVLRLEDVGVAGIGGIA